MSPAFKQYSFFPTIYSYYNKKTYMELTTARVNDIKCNTFPK